MSKTSIAILLSFFVSGLFFWCIPDAITHCPDICEGQSVMCSPAHGQCEIEGFFCSACDGEDLLFEVYGPGSGYTPVSLVEEKLCAEGCTCYTGSILVLCDDWYSWRLWCDDEIIASSSVYCSSE